MFLVFFNFFFVPEIYNLKCTACFAENSNAFFEEQLV